MSRGDRLLLLQGKAAHPATLVILCISLLPSFQDNEILRRDVETLRKEEVRQKLLIEEKKERHKQQEKEFVEIFARLDMAKEIISKMETKLNKQVGEIEKLKFQMVYQSEQLNEKVSYSHRLVETTSRSEIYGGGFVGDHHQHGLSSETTLGRSQDYSGGFSETNRPTLSNQGRSSYHGGFSE